jgi:hypothetical protein
MRYIKNDGGRFEEYDIKQLKKNNVGDCVPRAITIALGQPYKQTLKDLCELAMKRGAMPNDMIIYEEYLFSKGWVKNKPPRYPNGKKMRLRDWSHHRAIMSTFHHLTAIKDDCVNDTWDTREWCCNSYYTPADQIKPCKVQPTIKKSWKRKNYSFNQVMFNKNFEIFQTEIEKFKDGNKSAGTRSRKALMEITKLARVIRKEIQKQKQEEVA